VGAGGKRWEVKDGRAVAYWACHTQNDIGE